MNKEEYTAYNDAKALQQQGKHQEALDVLEEKIDPELNDASVHYLIGECFEGLDDLKMACECYKAAYLASLAF